jgi:hypothetical protein
MSNHSWFKKRRQNDEDMTSRRIVALIIVFFTSVVLCSLVLNVILALLPKQKAFCSQDDPILLVIKNSANQWYSTYSSTIRNTPIKIENDPRIYYPEGYGESSSGQIDLIFVRTGNDYVGLKGSEGYVYIPSDQFNFKFWFDYYWITRLEANFYCYKIK